MDTSSWWSGFAGALIGGLLAGAAAMYAGWRQRVADDKARRQESVEVGVLGLVGAAFEVVTETQRLAQSTFLRPKDLVIRMAEAGRTAVEAYTRIAMAAEPDLIPLAYECVRLIQRVSTEMSAPNIDDLIVDLGRSAKALRNAARIGAPFPDPGDALATE